MWKLVFSLKLVFFCITRVAILKTTSDLNLEAKQQKVVKMERELAGACAKREEKEHACR